MSTHRARTAAGVGLVVLVVGAAAVLRESPSPGEEQVLQTPVATGAGALANPADTYDPVMAGESLPSGFRQLLGRDQIAPVYDPSFTPGSQVDWPGGSLVIGVAGEESAKAYPVTHLNRREMVIDSLEGIPILVTW